MYIYVYIYIYIYIHMICIYIYIIDVAIYYRYIYIYISIARKTIAPSTWIQKDNRLEGNLKTPLLQLPVPDSGGSPELHHHAVPIPLLTAARGQSGRMDFFQAETTTASSC